MKVDDLMRIGDLFRRLGWPIGRSSHSPFPEVFDRFCRMCARLSPEQRNLIIEITENYQWIQHSHEEDLFLAAWDALQAKISPATLKIIVFPLLKPGSTRPKSCDAIYYLAKRFEANLRIRISPRQLLFCKKLGDLGRHFDSDTSNLVLLDDYVGTGDTAMAAVDKIRTRHPGIDAKHVIVLTLAAQHMAVNKLSSNGITAVTGKELRRGISDFLPSVSTPFPLEVMDRIGARIAIKKPDRLGYGKTEALTTLARTPNNTFPVFWTNKKVKGLVWPSPFTRFTERGR